MDIPYEWSAVRIGGWVDARETPFCEMIGSTSDLHDYFNAHKEELELEDGNPERAFIDTMTAYSDDTYYKNNALLLVLFSSPSGSNTYSVGDIQLEGEVLSITIREKPSVEIGTADMAYWAVFIELPAGYGVYTPQASITSG